MSRKTPNFVGRFSKKILRRYFWEIFLPEGDVFHCKFLPLQVVQKTGVGWKIEPQLVGVQRLPGLMIAAVHIAFAVLAVPQQGAAQVRHGGPDLVGDGKYGDGQVNRRYGETRQALYSYRLTFDFPTDAGLLNYLRGRSFQVESVPFREKYFG